MQSETLRPRPPGGTLDQARRRPRRLALACLAGLAGLWSFAVEPASAQSVRWDMQSTFPGSLTQLGTLGKRIEAQIALVSDGDIQISFQEPGTLVPALEVFDAVATGAVDAGWSTPGYWAGKVPALQLFAAVPFGPSAGEYMAWYYFGGGIEMMDELYARHGIKSVMCGILAPEASGWFKKEINTVEDFKGLKMRFFGLGARVMEKMGVSTLLIVGGDIYPALELGTIDAAEFSMPAIDLKAGLYQVAKHYYLPGWHQQATMFDLITNREAWDGLSDVQRAQIESVCGDNMRYGLAEGEAIQVEALAELERLGVNIHQWSPEILAALEQAWQEVVTEESAKDPDFARAWQSLASFRENYKVWKEIGYLQ